MRPWQILVALSSSDPRTRRDGESNATGWCLSLATGTVRRRGRKNLDLDEKDDRKLRIPEPYQEDVGLVVAFKLCSKAPMIRDTLRAKHAELRSDGLGDEATLNDVDPSLLELADKLVAAYALTMCGHAALDLLPAEDWAIDGPNRPESEQGPQPPSPSVAKASSAFDAADLQRVLDGYVSAGRTDSDRATRRGLCQDLCQLSDRSVRAGLATKAVDFDELVERESAGDTPKSGESSEDFKVRVANRLYRRYSRVRDDLHETARALLAAGKLSTEECEDARAAIDGLLLRRRRASKS
jgi:hypothetical protein